MPDTTKPASAAARFGWFLLIAAVSGLAVAAVGEALRLLILH